MMDRNQHVCRSAPRGLACAALIAGHSTVAGAQTAADIADGR